MEGENAVVRYQECFTFITSNLSVSSSISSSLEEMSVSIYRHICCITSHDHHPITSTTRSPPHYHPHHKVTIPLHITRSLLHYVHMHITRSPSLTIDQLGGKPRSAERKIADTSTKERESYKASNNLPLVPLCLEWERPPMVPELKNERETESEVSYVPTLRGCRGSTHLLEMGTV